MQQGDDTMATIEIEIDDYVWDEDQVRKANAACLALAIHSTREARRRWRNILCRTALAPVVDSAAVDDYTARRIDLCHLIDIAGRCDIPAAVEIARDHLRDLDEGHGIIHEGEGEPAANGNGATTTVATS